MSKALGGVRAATWEENDLGGKESGGRVPGAHEARRV